LVITKVYLVHFGHKVAFSYGIKRAIDDFIALKHDFKCVDEDNKTHIKEFINKIIPLVH
jgi:hypothetical protein